MDKNILIKLSKKRVAIKNISRTPLWYTKFVGKLDSNKPQTCVEEHTKRLFCNYMAAAKKLNVYFSAAMAEAYTTVNMGNMANEGREPYMPDSRGTTEAEKRNYENMCRNYMTVVRENADIKAAAADAQAFVDAANQILVSRMSAMRKTTLAHIHAYLSGVCGRNAEMNIDLEKCFHDCLINEREGEGYVEKEVF